MSRANSTTNEANGFLAARRRKLLLSTALGCGIFAGIVSMPHQARAANECGAIPPGPNSTVNCVGLVIPQGVEYAPAPPNETFTLNIGNGTIPGATVVAAPPLAGIEQVGVVVAQTAGPLIIAPVFATSVVNVTEFSVVQGSGGGVLVWVDGANNNATINNDGTVLATGAGAGFLFNNFNGNGLMAVADGRNGVATVNNNATGVVNANNNGLVAFALGGPGPGSNPGAAVVTNNGSVTTVIGDGISTIDPLNLGIPTFGTATVTNNGTLTTGRHGINAIATGDVVVNLGADSVINAGNFAGNTGTGVVAISLGGNATVNGDAASQTTSVDGPGIVAASFGAGTTTVTAGTVNAGSGNLLVGGFLPVSGGVIGIGGSGGSTVNLLGSVTINQPGALVGAAAVSFGGAATLDMNGNAVGGSNANNDPVFGGAAVVLGGTGNATITTDGAQVFASNVGLFGLNTGSGATVINSTGSDTNSVASGGIGILGIAGTGGVTIDAGLVQSNAPFAGPVQIGGIGGSGVIGASFGGDVNINLHGDVETNGGTFGALAFSLGGNATVTSDQGITVDPPIGMASIVIGPGTATVNNNALVQSTLVGLLGVNIGAGNVVINNNATGVVQADTGAGIVAFKIGPQGVDPGVLVNNSGTVNAPNGPGIAVIAFDIGTDVNVVVNNIGTVIGGGGILSPTVGILADGNVTVNNAGFLDNQVGINNNDFTGVTVGVIAGGAVAFNNDGTTFGNVGILSLGSTATVNNNFTGLWNSNGVNLITANGDSTVNNTGVINFNDPNNANVIDAVTVIASLNGNAALNNNQFGEINIGNAGNPQVVFVTLASPNAATVNNSANLNVDGVGGIFVNGIGVFNSIGSTLEFNNAGGLLSMTNGNSTGFTNATGLTYTGYNTGIGDITVIGDPFGILPAGNFNGTGKSQLGVDAFLSGPNNSSSDLMVVSGSTSGKTGIIVNDLNGGPGTLNTKGIPVVAVVSGNTSGGHFFIDSQSTNFDSKFGGVIDKGLFFYHLTTKNDPFFNTANGFAANGVDHVLVSAPDSELFELSKASTGAQNIWHETTGTWLERTADLRNFLLARGAIVAGAGADMPVKARPIAPPPIRPVTPGVWLKALGSWTDRDATDNFTSGGRNFQFDTSYKQRVFGLIGGIDGGWDYGSSAWIVGLLGGYLDSNLDFKASPNSLDYKGGTVGGYATYLNQNFFIDAIFKADLLKMTWNANTLAGFGFAAPETDANSYGFTVDTGYRFNYTGYFFEPLATFSWVRTEIDAINVFGTNIDFGNSDSMRGSLGGRFGFASLWGAAKVETSITARVWHEFEDPSPLTVVNGALALQDQFDGTYGDVNGTMNFIWLTTGWSSFVNGGVKFNSDFTTVSAKGGVRYQW